MRTVFCVVAVLLSAAAAAQDAAKADLRILVGFPPGGTVDSIARIVADRLRSAGGTTTVIVENKPGAGGFAAARSLAGAAPDGSVLLLAGISALAIQPLIRPEDAFDPGKDLTPVTLATTFEYGLAVANSMNVRTLKELVEWARANPSKAAFGSPGAGSLPHLFGVLFTRSAGVDMTHRPFKGGAPLISDLVGGHVPAGVSPLTDYLEPHRAGRLRLLATSGARRSAATPDVPTFVEQGFNEVQSAQYFAFWAPARTPAGQIARRSRELGNALRSAEASEKLVRLGQRPVSGSPEEVARILAAETAKWAPIVKAAHFAPER